jgi:DNA-binding NarL/FixJ family response regulator
MRQTSVENETIHILVVDDEPLIRQAICALLKMEAGVRVSEAASGVDAIALAAALHPDLILLDLHLQDMHGLQVIYDVLSRQPQMRIVLCSASASDEQIAAGLYAGACWFTSKSELGNQLSRVIDEAQVGQQARLALA